MAINTSPGLKLLYLKFPFFENLVQLKKKHPVYIVDTMIRSKKAATKTIRLPEHFPAPDLTLQNICAARRRSQLCLMRTGAGIYKTQFNRINAFIRRYTKKLSRAQWEKLWSSSDMHTPISKVYRIIDSLSGKRKQRAPHASLALSRGTNIANVAEEFADRYAAIQSKPPSNVQPDTSTSPLDTQPAMTRRRQQSQSSHLYTVQHDLVKGDFYALCEPVRTTEQRTCQEERSDDTLSCASFRRSHWLAGSVAFTVVRVMRPRFAGRPRISCFSRYARQRYQSETLRLHNTPEARGLPNDYCTSHESSQHQTALQVAYSGKGLFVCLV